MIPLLIDLSRNVASQVGNEIKIDQELVAPTWLQLTIDASTRPSEYTPASHTHTEAHTGHVRSVRHAPALFLVSSTAFYLPSATLAWCIIDRRVLVDIKTFGRWHFFAFSSQSSWMFSLSTKVDLFNLVYSPRDKFTMMAESGPFPEIHRHSPRRRSVVSSRWTAKRRHKQIDTKSLRLAIYSGTTFASKWAIILDQGLHGWFFSLNRHRLANPWIYMTHDACVGVFLGLWFSVIVSYDPARVPVVVTQYKSRGETELEMTHGDNKVRYLVINYSSSSSNVDQS